jgi:hypothetical protein
MEMDATPREGSRSKISFRFKFGWRSALRGGKSAQGESGNPTVCFRYLPSGEGNNDFNGGGIAATSVDDDLPDEFVPGGILPLNAPEFVAVSQRPFWAGRAGGAISHSRTGERQFLIYFLRPPRM